MARHLLLALAALYVTNAAAFGVPGPLDLPPVAHDVASLLDTSTAVASGALAAALNPIDILSAYKAALATSPLGTKMATGGAVAIMGDAIAQSRNVDEEYNRKRAISFMLFDMCYRALQHTAYPPLVEHFRGQYISGIVSAIPPLAHFVDNAAASGADPTYYMAVTEQTLSSQLGIVPFLYYPVFYCITGFVQGLTVEGTVQRAKETFIPLMKRNLLFWIPVQFVQFGFIEENLQIPFITVCGLCWTIILSVMAGAAQSHGSEKDANYCITGTEDGCEIDPDDLFPHILEEFNEADKIVRLELEADEKLQVANEEESRWTAKEEELVVK